MNILFGMYLDGVAWSRFPATIGEVRTGPQGLLGILETRLGISQPLVHPVHRINAYLQRLKAIDGADAWFHKSFTVDPWSTTRQLLEWRDELIEAGWQGNVILAGSPRLETLAELEQLDILLPDGRADRLRSVIKLLEMDQQLSITSVQLIEPLLLLPPVWQYVIELLEKQGVRISYRIQADRADRADWAGRNSNLALVQAVARHASKEKPLDLHDDSLILLKTNDEWEAAEQLALWLASKPTANDQVAIICGADTNVLDQALVRHGLPRLGRAEPSRWREIQQILPLVLVNAWQPVDIRLLVELLSLSSSPFPRSVCRSLLKAITKEPGVGGDAWKAVLSEITEKRKIDLIEKDDARAEEKSLAFARDIQAFLVDNRFDPVTGIPEQHLRERCQKVIDWLGWRLETDPLLSEAVSHAREIQKLSIGQDRIPRITLERMLDTVIGMGSTADDCHEEVSQWQVVDHPGQIVDPCKELIWWGFNDPAAATPVYWSDLERKALRETGVELEESSCFRNRESFSWQNGFLGAEERFIAIYMAQLDGEESYHHPLWDSIINSAIRAAIQSDPSVSSDSVQACLVKDSTDFDHKKEWAFAGRRHILSEVPETIPTPVVPYHRVPASVIKTPERLSYTQMSTLIGCPMKWALEYHAGLEPSVSQTVPTGNQMIGSFCHRIIQELYSTGKHWDAEEASSEAGLLFDRLLPAMASELLLEGNAIERQRYKVAIVEAVRRLTEAINRCQLRVEKTEANMTASINGIPFIGFADLLLRDAEGHPFVLDLKWSSSSKYRRQEVEEGSALQLAAYAWMLKSVEPAEQVHTGYFMLAQGQLISDSSRLTDEVIQSPYSLDEVWQMGVASLNAAYSQITDGSLEARGVMELMMAQERALDEDKVREDLIIQNQTEGKLYQRPPCRFCDFGRLCGWSGGVR